jgi:phosphatidylglycerophosphate synthase
VRAVPFFAVVGAGAVAAILTSHASSADVPWMIGGALVGGYTALRFARTHYRMRTSQDPMPPTDRQRVRAVAMFSAGLGVFANAVLPQEAWLPIFAYVATACLIIAVYYAWFVATARRH